MTSRRKTDVAEMWINPRFNFGHQHEQDRRSTDAADARYLELADVALRPTSSDPKKVNNSARLLPTVSRLNPIPKERLHEPQIKPL